LIGGLAAASLGGMAVAEAAPAPAKLAPEPTPPTSEGEVSAEMKQGIDGADAEFSQYYYRRPYYRRYGYYRRPYYRPYGFYRRPYYRPYGYYRRPYYRRRFYY
jgi:hypothetical protein